VLYLSSKYSLCYTCHKAAVQDLIFANVDLIKDLIL